MISCKASSFNFEISPSRQITFKRYLPSLQAKYPSHKNTVFSSSIEGQKWNTRATHTTAKASQRAKKFQKEEEEGEGERKMHYEVEVISWRERRIKAQILVYADIQSVWNALTDYERLADFIPNLVCSGRIHCPHPGRIWLEQRGFQRALYWHIEARVVLDLQEFPHSANNRELHFSMVDGDFKKFEGKWSLKSGTRHGTTALSYEVNVMPRYNFPAIFLERIIGSDLPVNLKALACRAERDFEGKAGITESEASMTVPTSPSVSLDGAFREKDKLTTGDLKESYPSSTFSLIPPPSNDLNNNWGMLGKACRLERRCMVDEVHLRRFDGQLVTDLLWLLSPGFPLPERTTFVLAVADKVILG